MTNTRIIRDYYKQVLIYANKMDNLGEMDKFIEMNTLLRLYQEETGIWNRSVTSTETETMIKDFQQTKVQEQVASGVNCIKHLEKS